MRLRILALCLSMSVGVLSARPQGTMAKAREALQARDTVGAMTMLEEALRDRITAIEARTLIAHIAIAQGRNREAVNHLDAVLGAEKTNVEATAMRALAHWKLRDTLKALNDFRMAAKIAPRDPDVLLAYGRALLNADSADRAMVVLSTAKVYAPKNAAIYESLGDAFSRLSLPLVAIKNYTECLKFAPKSVTVQMKLANVLLDQRRYSEAVRAFAVAHAIDSTFAEAYLEEGRIYVRAKLYARAVGPLRTFERLRPGVLEADTLLIRALSGAGNHVAAARKAGRVLNNDSSSAVLWRAYAHALVRARKYADAPAAFASLSRRAALTGDDYVMLADAYVNTGMNDKSLSAYLNAVRIDSTLSEPYNKLGILYMKRREYAHAADMFERYIHGRGRHVSAFLNGGACYLALAPGAANRDSLLRRARELLLSAQIMSPRNLTIRFRLAQYYILSDSFDLAQDQYKEVLKIAADEPGKHSRETGEAWSQIAIGHSARKEYTKASEAFSRAAAAGYENSVLYLQWGLAVMQTVSQNSSPQERRDITAKSERLFRQCIKRDPKNAQGHFWLGETLIRMRVEGENELIKKLTAEACREFTRALALDPSLDAARKELTRYGCK